jgi:hypothetical protein
MVKLRGCQYVLWINDRPYVGQSRRLDKDGLPTVRWKRHIADSQTSDIYLYRAIRKHGIQRQEVLEYIEYEFDIIPSIVLGLLKKTTSNKKLGKYKNMLKCILDGEECDADNDESYDVSQNITLDVTKDETEVISHINRFIDNLNKAEAKWVEKLNSMMPERGGNGYNHAPPGGALLHEPHTEEHKKYMSELMKGRVISQEQRIKQSEKMKGRKLDEAHGNAIANFQQKKFKDKIFPKRLAEWIIQYNKKGRNPDSNSEDPDERHAGQWRIDMLFKREGVRSRAGLTDEQIKILDETPGWTWRRDEFIEQFENFKIQYVKYDGKLSRGTKDLAHLERHKASLWVNAMRVKKRNNHPYLTPERIKMLDDCEFWSWIPTTFLSFDEQVKRWSELYNKINRIPSTSSEESEERKIACWQIRMRIDYHHKEKRMTQERIDKLNALQGWVW